MRGPHDVGGLKEGSVDPNEHELAIWEKQADAMLQTLVREGIFRVDEVRRTIEQFGHDIYDTLDYYERWTAALQRLLIDKGLLTQDELDERIAIIRKRSEASGKA